MFDLSRRVAVTTSYAIGLAALVSCTKDPLAPAPTGIVDQGDEEICASSMNWLPNTPDVKMFLPLPHPDSECPFYRGAWQNFLIATQPMDGNDPGGRPAILSYPTVGDVFKPKVPRPANHSFLGDVKQAGGRQILIDQNGNTLFYGIHVNPAFAQFIKDNDLQTAEKLVAYPNDPVKKNLVFPPGVAEYKTAWQVVEGDEQTVQQMTADYIWTKTTVPTLSQDPDTKVITEDRNNPRPVTARLLAIHVVFTLPGHPEFIWGSFEHSTGTPDVRAADGKRDVAPTIGGENPQNPPTKDPENRMNMLPVDTVNHVLYAAMTPANLANTAIPSDKLTLVGQKFPNQATSVYRMFPASKSNTVHPDDAVTSLNHNVEALFQMMASALPANDKRGHYRLVGAQWMDKPRFFQVNIPIQNDESSPFLQDHLERQGDQVVMVKKESLDTLSAAIADEGSDSPLSILAGEDRMSSTAMESFTQGVRAFPNCFSCHNTQAVVANGIPLRDGDMSGGAKLLDPGFLNVSHVLSQFLLEEQEAAAAPAK